MQADAPETESTLQGESNQKETDRYRNNNASGFARSPKRYLKASRHASSFVCIVMQISLRYDRILTANVLQAASYEASCKYLSDTIAPSLQTFCKQLRMKRHADIVQIRSNPYCKSFPVSHATSCKHLSDTIALSLQTFYKQLRMTRHATISQMRSHSRCKCFASSFA